MAECEFLIKDCKGKQNVCMHLDRSNLNTTFWARLVDEDICKEVEDKDFKCPLKKTGEKEKKTVWALILFTPEEHTILAVSFNKEKLRKIFIKHLNKYAKFFYDDTGKTLLECAEQLECILSTDLAGKNVVHLYVKEIDFIE